jgi:RNA polymerase sigma-70 factor (ECF subfamily)
VGTKTKNIHDQLIEACKQGKVNAQTQLYDMYCGAMYNTALRILDDEFLAEDVMQESFLSAFHNLNSFKAEVSIGAWLKRIVINRSINEVKKRQKQLDILSEVKEEWTDHVADQPIVGLTVERVQQAMEALSDGYRIIISLYLLEGYDHEEISEILGISASTSRSQYSSCLLYTS